MLFFAHVHFGPGFYIKPECFHEINFPRAVKVLGYIAYLYRSYYHLSQNPVYVLDSPRRYWATPLAWPRIRSVHFDVLFIIPDLVFELVQNLV